MLLLLAEDFFFSKKFFQDHYWSECQTVWIQIRTDILLVLIWIQTVCKVYQQKTEFPASKERGTPYHAGYFMSHTPLQIVSNYLHIYIFTSMVEDRDNRVDPDQLANEEASRYVSRLFPKQDTSGFSIRRESLCSTKPKYILFRNQCRSFLGNDLQVIFHSVYESMVPKMESCNPIYCILQNNNAHTDSIIMGQKFHSSTRNYE